MYVAPLVFVQAPEASVYPVLQAVQVVVVVPVQVEQPVEQVKVPLQIVGCAVPPAQ